MEQNNSQGDAIEEGNQNSKDTAIPATQIVPMQRVGTELGIDPAKLTKEQLEAEPKKASGKEGEDD
jgi:hypothetical protein